MISVLSSKRIAKPSLHILAFSLVTIIVVGFGFQKIVLDEGLLTRWDHGIHYSAAVFQCAESGYNNWNPYFTLGHPENLTYPPLFHIVVRGVCTIIPVELAYRLVLFLCWLLFIFAAWKLTNAYISNTIIRVNAYVLLLTWAIVPDPFWWTTLSTSLFQIGLIGTVIGVPLYMLLLVVLTNKNINSLFIQLILLLSVILLTNLFVVIFTLFTIGVWIVVHFIETKSWKDALRIMVGCGWSLLIASFWYLPFLLQSHSNWVVNIEGYPGDVIMTWISSLFLLAGVIQFNWGHFDSIDFNQLYNISGIIYIVLPILLLIRLIKQHLKYPYFNLTYVLGYLGVFLSQFFIPIRNFFMRFMIIYSILLIVLIGKGLDSIKKYHRAISTTVISIFIIGLVSAIRCHPPYPQDIEQQVLNLPDEEYIQESSERILSIFPTARDLLMTNGLYMSMVVPQQVAQYSLNTGYPMKPRPESFTWMQLLKAILDKTVYQHFRGDPGLVNDIMTVTKEAQFAEFDYVRRMLGVNTVWSFSYDAYRMMDVQETRQEEIDISEDLKLKVYMFEKTPLIELPYWELGYPVPDTLSEEELQMQLSNKKLFVAEEALAKIKPNYKNKNINIEHAISRNSINIQIQGERIKGTPIHIKFDYYPNWKAFQGEEEIEVYPLQPTGMLIVLENDESTVDLIYARTKIEKVGGLLSLIGIVGFIFYMGHSIYQKRLHKKGSDD